jgi:nucleoside-diphosphate-sugar epimerase
MTKTVLITGLNGFIAVHCAVHFLENGWHVRGTARSQEKVEQTLALPALAPYAKDGKISAVVVDDLQSGDLSSALQGIDAVSAMWAVAVNIIQQHITDYRQVAHVASPIKPQTSWKNYLVPAVEATTHVLEEVARFPRTY